MPVNFPLLSGVTLEVCGRPFCCSLQHIIELRRGEKAIEQMFRGQPPVPLLPPTNISIRVDSKSCIFQRFCQDAGAMIKLLSTLTAMPSFLEERQFSTCTPSSTIRTSKELCSSCVFALLYKQELLRTKFNNASLHATGSGGPWTIRSKSTECLYNAVLVWSVLVKVSCRMRSFSVPSKFSYWTSFPCSRYLQYLFYSFSASTFREHSWRAFKYCGSIVNKHCYYRCLKLRNIPFFAGRNAASTERLLSIILILNVAPKRDHMRNDRKANIIQQFHWLKA